MKRAVCTELELRTSVLRLACLFSVIYECLRAGRLHAFVRGMNFWIIFFAAQVTVTIIAVVCEKKNKSQFEGDKLGYRS